MGFINVAPWDRTIRILIGLVMLLTGWFGLGEDLAAAALKVLGWIPVVTGALGWSPLYAILGFSTKRRNGAAKSP